MQHVKIQIVVKQILMFSIGPDVVIQRVSTVTGKHPTKLYMKSQEQKTQTQDAPSVLKIKSKSIHLLKWSTIQRFSDQNQTVHLVI